MKFFRINKSTDIMKLNLDFIKNILYEENVFLLN